MTEFSIKYPNSISRLNGYEKDAITYVPVVVVGAGESGIAMGCQLKEKLGFDQFRIFDRQAGVGGTWWINRYPGVACDVPAVFYSFSFAPNHKWTTFYPPGPEIVKYLNDVANKYEITDKIQCNTDIEGCKWLEHEQIWEVYLRHMVPGTGDLSVKDRNMKIEAEGEHSVFIKREIVKARVVVSCVGGLVEPNPKPKGVPGWENFQGDVFHSARWDYGVDLKDKEVVVVGTGCSAAQFVPQLTKQYGAKKVTQIMRSPPWVVPRIKPPFGTEWWEKYSPTVMSHVPGLSKLLRTMIFLGAEHDFRLFGGDEYHATERKKVEAQLVRNIKKKVPEEYHELLIPDYGVGCKRRIFDATWFPGLNDENIELTTQPFTEVKEHSVVVGPGQMYPVKSAEEVPESREVKADVIVLANGFETTKFLHPLKVTGRNNEDLVGVMDRRGGPQAYQGTAMDGFPNFFMIFGPNTATGHSSVILASENMVQYSLKFIKKILDGDASSIEVKKEAEVSYTENLQRALKKTVFNSGGCNSWYTHGDWNGTVYPHTQIWFGLRCMFPVWSHWNITLTTKGLWKQRLGSLLRAVIAAVVIISTYNARKSGDGIVTYFRNQLLMTAMRARMALSSD